MRYALQWRKVRCCNQRFFADIPAVYHVVDLLKSVFRTPLHAEIIKDKQGIGAEPYNVLISVFRPIEKVVEYRCKVRHTDRYFPLHKGICDTACKITFPRSDIPPQDQPNPEDVPHARIYGRLLEMCTPVRFTGDDFRRAAAQQKKERLKELMMENKAVQAEGAGL